MKTTFLKYLSVALASTLKFFGGPIAGVMLKLTWIETALCSAVGMMFTVFVLTYLGGAIRNLIQKNRKTPPKNLPRPTALPLTSGANLGL
jgi:hypothetical protein